MLLHESWEKQAKKLLTLLWKYKDSEIFHKPVNPIEQGVPNYFNIVKNPMDFSLIKKKLREYQYTNFKEFCKDMDLVFNNCFLFNGEKSTVGQLCKNVKDEYLRLYNSLKMDKFY